MQLIVCKFLVQVYVMGDDLVVSKVGSNTRQLRTIENFVIHPKYDQDTLDSDIAIIRVRTLCLNQYLSQR